MTCGCLDECNCNENRTCSCPNIVGAGQVDISTLVEGEVEIFAPENSTVSSDDESVTIVETENSEGSINYDLSVTCCDKKVGACVNDPLPGTLDEKLFVSAPLTRTISNCSTNGRMTIGIDASQLADEKVKVDGDCDDSLYLVDAIEAGNGIRTYVNNCKLVIETEPVNFVKPMAKMVLASDYEVFKSHSIMENAENGGWFVIPVTVEIDNNTDNNANRIVYDTTSALLGFGNVKCIKIMKDGFYRVSFKFNCDINYGVHALRGCVFSTMTGKGLVIDDKDQGEASGFGISQSAVGDAMLDITYAKQLSYSSSDVSYFKAGTCFILGGRMDPYVTEGAGAGKDGWAVIRRAGLDGGILSGGVASENSEAGCVMSVERYSDEDGGILYK